MSSMLEKASKLGRLLFGSWSPRTKREASDAVGFNFLMHWFPARITVKSLSFGYSFWLGTISASLFIILSVTGVVLMFLYVPSIERAYQSIKDIEYVVSYGWLIRRMHRWAAHGMVLFVFLHMIRVFLTAAYRSTHVTPGGQRPLNWLIGVVLLLLTMLLSYTGYLLPWDQLALWAIVIGANIAAATPFIGQDVRFFMQGGTIIGQNTILLWYAMHVAILPLLTLGLISWHMWRIRKDGGLASVDSLAIQKEKNTDPNTVQTTVKGKSYALMGTVKGTRPTVVVNKLKGETVIAVPTVLTRIMIVFIATFTGVLFISLFFPVPLEEAATFEWTPNPAKAPWYFLWLQELVTITTVRLGGFTLNGGFVGGIIIPGILGGLLAAWPFLDKSTQEAVGVWFHKSRIRQNAVFLYIIFIMIVMIYISSEMRGPNWDIYWPWEKWPVHAVRF